MHIIGKITAVSALLCMVFLVVSPVAAFPAGDRNVTCPVAGSQGDRMSGLLDMLSEKGYDVSTIQSAMADGNMSAARALLDQLKADANITRPERPAGELAFNGSHMNGLLIRLEESGIDVSAIRSAIESGDKDAARDLLDQLKATANITLPEPPMGKMGGNESRMEGLLNMLTENGYDVSAIQSAITDGDISAARTLLDDLKEVANLSFPGGPHRIGGPACNSSSGFGGSGTGGNTVQVPYENGLTTTPRSQVQQYTDANQVRMPTVTEAGIAGGGRGHRNEAV